MKVLVALCIVAAVAYAEDYNLTPEQSVKLCGHVKHCIENTQVDKAHIAELRSGTFNKETVEDEKVKNFVTCMFKRILILNDSNQLQVDVVKAKLPPGSESETVNKAIEECHEKTKSEPADSIAIKAYQCYAAQPIIKVHILPGSCN